MQRRSTILGRSTRGRLEMITLLFGFRIAGCALTLTAHITQNRSHVRRSDTRIYDGKKNLPGLMTVSVNRTF